MSLIQYASAAFVGAHSDSRSSGSTTSNTNASSPLFPALPLGSTNHMLASSYVRLLNMYDTKRASLKSTTRFELMLERTCTGTSALCRITRRPRFASERFSAGWTFQNPAVRSAFSSATRVC